MIEIIDSTEIHTDLFRNEPSPICRCIPKGLSSVPDTIDLRPHLKPNILIRSTLSFGLWMLHSTLWLFHVCFWVINKITGPCSERSLYQRLRKILAEKENLTAFLEKEKTTANLTGFIIRELHALPELQIYLKEILDGANIRLVGDKGFFCQRWSSHPEAYRRISSHNYQRKECYGLGYICFWLDREGHTRFQFENNPLKGFQSSLYHLIDMLRYWRDNKQQGIAGISPYTESHCLDISIDLNSISTDQGA